MQRVTSSVQFEEVVLVRRANKSFLKLFNTSLSVPYTNQEDRGTAVGSQHSELSLIITNIGANPAFLKISGATRQHPAEDDDAYAEVVADFIIAPGGFKQLTIEASDINVLSLVPSVVSPEAIPTTLRVLGSSFAPWAVWKVDDQNDRNTILEPFLSDEDPRVFYAGVWPSSASSEP